MDCVETATTMGTRKAALGGEMLFFASPAGRYQHQLLYLQSPRSSALLQTEETAAGPPERAGGGAPWEEFSVDDLLDLGAGKEQNAGEDEFLPPDDAEDEEEEDRKESSSGGVESCSPSVLSFQAIPPSSDPIVPAGDVADLEWLSRFVDDSYSEFPSAVAAPPPLHNHHRYHSPVPATLQPEAKLEAPKPPGSATGVSFKRTWGSCCFSTDSLVVPAKARRSKRSRTGGRVWSSLRLPPLLPKSSSSSCSSGYSYASCSASSSISPLRDFAGGGFSSVDARLVRQERKKKGRKPKAKSMAVAAEGSGGGEQPARRRCSHCGVDRTPQWRAGPMGAKTLCNACGVRYKSGRLLPEYRPAGSPTFLGHIHSNSHRRVLEMRRKKELLAAGTPPPPLAAASPPYGVV